MGKKISQCGSCGGTGLYCGFAEPKGTAVICLVCEGKGWRPVAGTEFTGRKKRPNITKISQSRGTIIFLGVGAVGESMSYAEFERKYPINLPK
jgi:hypothetical protein